MAMSRSLLNAKDGDGIFECPVCLSSMKGRRPRALHCLHTFCEACLVEYAKHNQPEKRILSCPTCRKVTQLPPGGVTELPYNFQLDKLSAFLRHEKNVCQNCLETKQSPPAATFFCDDCQKKYCDSCKGKHEAIPVFSDHLLFPVSAKMPPENPNKCALHGMVLDLFCLVCQECLCSLCAMKQKHSGHYNKLINMRKVMDVCTQEAAEVIKPIKQKIPTWSDSLHNKKACLKKVSTSIERERDKRIQSIKAEAERLIEDLKKIQVKPVQECLTCLEALKKSTQATEILIQRKQCMPNTITELKRQISDCNENKRRLESKMEKLQKVPEFVATSELTNFGSLSTKATYKVIPLPKSRGDGCYKKLTFPQTTRNKRPSVDEAKALMRRGTRVKIGPDWNKDWKPAGEGTVRGCYQLLGVTSTDKVMVQWDEGGRTGCRVGEGGCYDIQLA